MANSLEVLRLKSRAQNCAFKTARGS